MDSPYAYTPLQQANPMGGLQSILQLMQMLQGAGAGSQASPFLALIQQLMGQHSGGGNGGNVLQGGGLSSGLGSSGAPTAFPGGQASNLWQPPASDPTMSFGAGQLQPPQGASAPASVGDWRAQQGQNALQGSSGGGGISPSPASTASAADPWQQFTPGVGLFGPPQQVDQSSAYPPLWSQPGASFPWLGAQQGQSAGFPNATGAY